MTMVIIWAAVFVLFGASNGISVVMYTEGDGGLNNKSGFGGPVPLDMAPNSVDDMYQGCEELMKNKVKNDFLMQEKNKVENFSLAWKEADKNYNDKWKRKHGKKPTLEKEQIMALFAYTLDKPEVYSEFNDAVRTQKPEYKTTFTYHTMHFFLTRALQILNSRKPEAERCVTGYRRIDKKFNQDVLSKEVRFGSFTSSSMGKYPRPDRFGDKTCFKIKTCFGADISLYSKFGESEREVLIPPYEVFQVTKIEKRSKQNNLPCEVVYTLKSTRRTSSNLNCALFSEKKSLSHNKTTGF